MKIEVLIADYLREQHSQDIGYLLNNYAADPMGGGAPLSDFIQQNLALELSKVPNAFSVICSAISALCRQSFIRAWREGASAQFAQVGTHSSSR